MPLTFRQGYRQKLQEALERIRAARRLRSILVTVGLWLLLLLVLALALLGPFLSIAPY